MPKTSDRAASGRVVITGLGAVTPVGKSVPEMWDGLLKGKSGVGLIRQFDTAKIACKIGAEVPDWVAEAQVGRGRPVKPTASSSTPWWPPRKPFGNPG